MTLTGVALIVLPLLAVVFKLVSFGWLSVFLLFGPVLLLAAGYALQIVIASQAFLSGRSPMPPGPGRVRATIAAWLTSLSAVLLSVFVIDGGDTGYGSTFQVWLGVYDSSADPEALHAATDGLSSVVAQVAGWLWVGGFLWLVVEWVVFLVLRRRARRADAAAPGIHRPAVS